MHITQPAAHFQRLAHLIDLEAEAEKQAALRDKQHCSPDEAESSGNTLVNLVIREDDSGLGGRFLLTLGKRNQNLSLPWTRLGQGSPVILSAQGADNPCDDGQGWRGVISRMGKDSLQVAFPQEPELQGDHPIFRLDRAGDEISRQRQRSALEKAQSAPANSRLAALRLVLLGEDAPLFCPVEDFHPLDHSLNASQCEAVRFALGAEDLAILHGPPGTGKTTTLVELIRQIVRRGQTVLACAPSNLAVDNLLERLLAAGENALRLGHPARVAPELREHTLDAMVENHPDVRLAHKLAREAYGLRERASRTTRARPEPGMRQTLRQEAKDLLAEARKIESQVSERLLGTAPIVCATLTGLDPELLGPRRFDWCVMDEAGQGTEPSAWIPILRCERLALAGDPFQLPPTVISREAASAGFGVSLLERLMVELGPGISRRLMTQYRMHEDIMQFSSQEFYAGSLAADPTVGAAVLQHLPGIEANPFTAAPLDFIDTAGASYDESADPDGESRLNPLEAELVLRKVQELLDAGLAATEIAVITPYAAQVRLLRSRSEKLRQPAVEIDTVDGFQGREKEAVVVSLVRSNSEGEIGFLEDVRRMNVALTRARRKLVVIGDSATVGNHPFYQRLIAYFEAAGAYHSVWEEG
ncbi:MAG: AAA domain-containing protein [Anaerolineaceae bacterium]|nr:AAA domain-containing protein [Anaerolineaceae bacterium]